MVKASGVEFRYQKTELFDKLDLDLAAGRVYGLLGMNGAGKTTLLRLLAGLNFPKAGDIKVLGMEPGRRNPDFLSEIYFQSEDVILPNQRIGLFLKLNAPFYPRFSHEGFEGLRREFDLPLDKSLSRFSHGMKKKFMLAFAISSGARLLLLDEPTNGLDIPAKVQFRNVIEAARSPERAFLISTHQVRDLEELIDPLIILDQGKIVLSASRETLNSRLRVERREVPPDGSELYSERNPTGWYCLNPNQGQAAPLDLELLFNAVRANAPAIAAACGRGL